MRLTESQRILIRRLIFHEPFDGIQRETGLPHGVLRDDLLILMHKGLVEIYLEKSDGEVVHQMAYDSDRLNLYLFRASQRGLRYIQHP